MTTAAPETLSDLPSDKRQNIVIISDQEFDKRLKADKSDGSSGSALAGVGIIASLFVPGGVIARLALAGVSVAYARYTADNAKNSLIREVAVSHTNDLKFRPGAQVGQGYAVNPVSDKLYYPISSYYDDLMDHKISELERLLNALGAKHYQISYQESDSVHSNFSGKVGHVATASVDVELTKSRKRRFERSGTSEGREPTLPDVQEWYHLEPSWQSLAKSRMNHGRKEFGSRVELEQTFRLSTKVIAGFKSIGLEFGAGHDQDTNFVLSVTGSF